MTISLLYKSKYGRSLILFLRNTGLFFLINHFLKSKISKILILPYIAKNHINMQDYEGQKYNSFEEFFARRRKEKTYDHNPQGLMSPCDGLLSIYEITEDLNIPMKGSHYRLCDIVPDKEIADLLRNGICMVFRLQASDYHHFCAFDDITIQRTSFIPSELQSVQPIVCEKCPVYHLNRRWWSHLSSANFGDVVQIKIGAMLVSGVHFSMETKFTNDNIGSMEIPVNMGERIGVLKDVKSVGIIT